LLGTVTSIAFHAVTGAYALVGAIVAGACLAATLAVLVRGVGREVYESLTYDARGTSQG